MRVADIMTVDPVTVDKNAYLSAALETMAEMEINHLPVVDAEKHVVGVLSDRDCRKALDHPLSDPNILLSNELASQIKVRKLMTAAPIVVEPTASASQAARLMLLNNISCLPVMLGETLVGIVTKSDILIAFMRALEKNEVTAKPAPFISLDLVGR